MLTAQRDTAHLAFFLGQIRPGPEALSAASALARELGAAGALALLLEAGRPLGGGAAARRFAL